MFNEAGVNHLLYAIFGDQLVNLMLVQACDCTEDTEGSTTSAEWQDHKYGKGQRLHAQAGATMVRCSVCGKRRTKIKRDVDQQ